MDPFVVEKIFHHSVSRLAFGFMVDSLDLLEGGSFCFVPGVLAVLPVVVICIRTYVHVLKQPVDTEAL